MAFCETCGVATHPFLSKELVKEIRSLSLDRFSIGHMEMLALPKLPIPKTMSFISDKNVMQLQSDLKLNINTPVNSFQTCRWK